MTKRVLSFGGGVQTTALVFLMIEKKIECDMLVFADTGVERPETYFYIDEVIKPLLEQQNLELITVRNEVPSEQPDLYGYYWNRQDIPSVNYRRCTDHFKLRPIKKLLGKDNIHMIVGFSADEINRAKRKRTLWAEESYPLIEMGLTGADCQRLIAENGYTIPLKSSCYICPFQPPFEWKWLKEYHPDLFQKALDLEARYHERKPEWRDKFGLYRGLPLRHIAEGKQYSMGLTMERSCWDGVCGH